MFNYSECRKREMIREDAKRRIAKINRDTQRQIAESDLAHNKRMDALDELREGFIATGDLTELVKYVEKTYSRK